MDNPKTMRQEAARRANAIERLLGDDKLSEALALTMNFPEDFLPDSSASYYHFRAEVTAFSASVRRHEDVTARRSRNEWEANRSELIYQMQGLIRRMQQAVDDLERSTPSSAVGSSPPVSSKRPTVVSVQNCEKSFGSPSFSLGPLSFDVEQGDTLALMGANASGKSTLLRILLGELAPSKGAITYPGLAQTHTYRGRRSTIGYVPQFPPAWRGPLRENLHYYLSTRGITGPENNARVEYYLQKFRLTSYQHMTWQEISGGYRLRFALARELLVDPKLLVLDEPLAHLDAVSQIELLDIISRITRRPQRPATVIFTSQHIYETERFCSKVLVLRDGKVKAFAPLALLGAERVFRAFEIESDDSVDKVRRCFGNMPVKISGTHPVYVVDLPRTTTIQDAARILGTGGVVVRSLRDITNSSRVHFDGEGDSTGGQPPHPAQ